MKWFLLTLLFQTNLYAQIETTWEKIKEDDGITVYRGEVKNSKVVAFKGEADIDASIEALASVLYDMEHKMEWVDRLKEAKIVKQIAIDERIEYNQTKTPWPLTNRDFVFHAKIELSQDKKTAIFKMKSTEDENTPEVDGVVRADLKESMYKIEKISDSKSHFSVEILADPKGSVPKWIVNMFQKKWPMKTIKGIKGQVANPKFEIHPKVLEIFGTPAPVSKK